MSETKKRLPVLKQTPEEEQGEEPRPPWHWVGFGACASIGIALPLTYVSGYIAARVLPDYETTPGPLGLALLLPPFIIGGFVGGFLVGRWGGEKAGVREAALAGGLGQLLLIIMAIAQTGIVTDWRPYAMWLATICIVTLFAAWGGHTGLRRRIRKMTPNIR